MKSEIKFYIGITLVLFLILSAVTIHKGGALRKIKAEGEQILTAVDYKQEVYKVKSRTNYENKIKFRVEAEIPYYIWLEVEELSAEEREHKTGIDAAIMAARKETQITRYLFSDEDGHIYVSEKSATVQEYREETLGLEILMLGLLLILGTIPLILLFVVWLAKKPVFRKIRQERPDCVICDSVSVTYAVVATLSLVMAVALTAGWVHSLKENGDMEMMLMFGILLPMFWALFICFVVIMWNRIVILDINEIVFYNSFGKKTIYPVNQLDTCKEVRYLQSYKNQIILSVNGKRVFIEADGNCYGEALEFINQHYVIEKG